MSTTDETFTLTREQVYELVWTTPIQKLAREWGISDVGLAKILRGMDIPRPGRGYWAKVAAGETPPRARLPATSDPSNVLRVFRSPLADQPVVEPPVVEIASKLEAPHAVVRWLVAALNHAPKDQFGRLRVGDKYSAPICVGDRGKGRALRILDGFIKALAARGTDVVIGHRYPHARVEEIVVQAGECGVPLEIEERLQRKPHVLTRDEKRAQNKWPTSTAPEWDYYADGKLCLRVPHATYSYRKRKWWRDEDDRSLESQLGRAIVAIEDIVKLTVLEEQERKAREEQAAIEQRRELRGERMQWYSKRLINDLDQMIAGWRRAQDIRDFLAEYSRRCVDQANSERSQSWRAAMAAYADEIDPMQRPHGIAKELDPSDKTLEQLIAEANATQRLR